MGDGLVGAMVAALRRANRDWAAPRRVHQPDPASSGGAVTPTSPAADCGRRAERCVEGRAPSGAARAYLTHPALMPTIFSPGDGEQPDMPEDVAARKV